MEVQENGHQLIQDNNLNMKNMKKINYILSIIVLSIVFIGCDDNDVSGVIDESAKPVVTFAASSTAAVEFESTQITIAISMDKPIKTTTTFSAAQIGGNAVLGEDYTVSGGVIPAYQKEGELIINIIKDTELEGNESIDFQIGASAVPDLYEVIGTQNLSVSIEDWVFCFWTLETSDTYGDGWNGGFVEVTTTDAGTTTYAADDDVPDVFNIAITDGVDFSFTYVSGGGTGAAPGWESENYFKLTAPDGTVWEEGTQDYSGIPTSGVITSGVNDCP